jgi:hypothetical protein
MPRPPRPNKEKLKNIKVTASTHARLAVLATIFDKTIADLIEDLLDKAYPGISQETDAAMNKLRKFKEEDDEE